MRTLRVLALQVCLAAACRAGEWQLVHWAGVEAHHRGDYSAAMEKLEASWPLAGTPFERAINANDLGATLHRIGRESEARKWFELALSIWRDMPGESDSMAQTAIGLTDAYRGLGDFSAAEKTLRSAIEWQCTLDHKASLQNALGDLLREQDRLDEARSWFEATTRLGDISRIREIDVLLGLADIDLKSLRFEQSIKEWTRGVELARAEGNEIVEGLAIRGLGLARENTGDFAGAEPLLRRALAIFQKRTDHPRQLAATLSCLGLLYREQNKYSLAEDAWLQALNIYMKTAGEQHPQTAAIMDALAELYSAERRFDSARDYASRALAIMQQGLGPQSSAAAGALGTLALVQQRESQPEAAAASYATALDILRKNHAMSGQGVYLMHLYASVLATLHRTREAKQVQAELKSFHAR